MQWLEKNYDKALLILVSALSLVFSILYALRSLGIAGKFARQTYTETQEMPPTGAEDVEAARQHLSTPHIWERKPFEGYRVPLLVSVPIIEMEDGTIVNMLDPKIPPLRAAGHPREEGVVEVPNPWLQSYRLDFTSTGVLQADPDGDGFTNLEEYVGNTDPTKNDSHPPYITQLYLAERGEDTYKLKFSAIIDPQFQITRSDAEIGDNTLDPRSWFKAVGETFPDKGDDQDRFTIEEFRPRIDEDGLDTSVLVIRDRDRLDNNPFELVRTVETDRPIFWANLVYRHKDPAAAPFRVDLGSTFTIPTEPDVTYTLEDVQEDHALISFIPEGATEKTVVRVPRK